MRKKYIFFDLDGVISDSKEGITKSVDYALRQFGILADSPDQYESFVGPPLVSQFKKECGFDTKQAEKAVEFYRVYYTKQGILENKMYVGIDSVIQMLYHRNCKVVLATSKPTEFARRIIDRYGILSYFSDICGSTMDSTRVKKEDVIAYAMKKNSIIHPQEVIMIGDRMHDIIGAHKNGVDCIAVEYGYGSIQELHSYQPEYLAKTITDLYKLLEKLC